MKRKSKWKLKLTTLSLLSIPIIGLAIFVPLYVVQELNQDKKLNYFNILTTYDNAHDNMTALGYAPDFDTTSSSGRIKYASYLNGYVNDEITEYVNVKIMDGQEVDRKVIDSLTLDTVVLNEWMKVDAYKFDGIVNNLAYTSMGDSDDARYNSPMTTGGYTWSQQNNIDAGFKMLANDLDNIYKLNGDLISRADSIIENDKKRISTINNSNKNILNGKTIGIIASSAQNKDEIENKFSFYSPYVYPMIYSNDPNKGIGLSFPSPKDSSFINDTHGYNKDASQIKGDSSTQLLQQFENKFDYLIFCCNDISYLDNKFSFDDVLNSNIKSLLKDQSNAKNNILFTSRGQWYESAWGIIGKREILTSICDFLNLKDLDQRDLWKPIEPDKQKRLRYFNK